MKSEIDKLNLVALLLEIENPESHYPISQLESELKNRNLTKNQLEKAYDQKNFVQEQRTRKAEAPLSLMYKIFIIASPFSDTQKLMHRDGNVVGEYEDFITQAGYKKKAREIKKYRRISGIVYLVTILILFIYFTFIR